MCSHSEPLNWLVYSLQYAESVWKGEWRADQMDKKVWKFIHYLSKIKEEKRFVYKESLFNGNVLVVFQRRYFNICCHHA